jgi:site-specific DNA-methyltransferase (adenine-specific)
MAKTNLAVHFSSKTDQWATPQGFFDRMNAEFNLELDVCADEDNAKCESFITEESDGLKQPWAPLRCWMNPPYGREIGKWVKKAHEESQKGALVVCLLPSRTDTRWFHSYFYQRPNVEIRFIKGRLKFGDAENAAPFPSMVAIFKPEEKK